MRVGVIIPGGGMPLSSVVDVARSAELEGAHGVWVTEAWRSAFVPLTAIAAATSRITLGTYVINAYGHSPFITGMSAIDLDEASAGRLVLGIGERQSLHEPALPGHPHGAAADEDARVRRARAAVRARTPRRHRRVRGRDPLDDRVPPAGAAGAPLDPGLPRRHLPSHDPRRRVGRRRGRLRRPALGRLPRGRGEADRPRGRRRRREGSGRASLRRGHVPRGERGRRRRARRRPDRSLQPVRPEAAPALRLPPAAAGL